MSRDPEVSFKTTQVLVKQIVEQQRLSQTQEGQYAFEFISSQAASYRDRLEKAENAVKEFRSRSTDVDEKVVQDRIRDIETDIQSLELSVQESQSVVQTTRAQLNIESQYLEVQSQVYTVRQNKAALERQLNALRMQYQESYPDIVTIKGQIAEYDRRLDELVADKNVSPRFFVGDVGESNPELIFDELRKQLNEEVSGLTAKEKRLSSLKALLDEQHLKLERVAENQAQLAELMRDYNVTKDTYEELLSRKENAGISVAITEEGQGLSYRVISEPTYPINPTGLTFLHFVLVAPILGIGIPLGLLLAMILLDPRIRTATTLGSELATSVPLLGVCPKYHTTIAERLLRKDMLLLSIAFGLFFIVYFYVFSISLNS
jgi:polysaccharide chain length determinant protein (PEP-CTERM system associated)